MVDNTHHTTRIKTVGRPFMATSSNRQYTFPTRVGRGFSPTSALQTPQCIDIANNDKGAECKDSVGLKTDLHNPHHHPHHNLHNP